MVPEAVSSVPTGRLYRSCRAGSSAVVRTTGDGPVPDTVAVVDAFTGGRPRTLSRSVLHAEDLRSRRRSGYEALPERYFVARLLNAALDKHFGNQDHEALGSVWAHDDWRSGGYARLAMDYKDIGRLCERALRRAGYGAETFPQAVRGYGSALRFRRAAEQPLCPALEIPRSHDGDWEPWSCDVARGHDAPHLNLAMRHRWVEDDEPERCGAYVAAVRGLGLGSCSLPAGHPPEQDHRDLLREHMHPSTAGPSAR
ncbi:hypothetical protein ACFC0S_15850 [Streptomyces sp. NPDC056084]|uniref:hypothetical protein n=1 Tax=unclassified Streptomyces TaxID=2593676 RepID=UPI0035D6AE05